MKQLLDEYKALKAQKQYMKIILANIINRFGDSVDAIALTWLVFELTHSPTWSTIIFGVNMIPSIFLQPFCGALVEKMKKRNIMVVCDMARGVSVCIIAYCYMINILTPWMVLSISIFNSTVEAFRVPAGTAIVPKLLDKEHYDSGTALIASLSRVMELLGTACAGVIIAVLGVSGAIFLDAITFFMSAICIGWIRYTDEIVQVKIDITSYFVTLKEGIRYIRTTKVVIMICVVGSFLNMMMVPLNSFMPVYIDEVMHAGSEMLSAINISITIGMVVGSVLYPILSKKYTRRSMILMTTFFSGLFYIGLIYIPMFISDMVVTKAIIIVLNFILGFIIAILNTSITVLLMSCVKEDYLARVSAVFGAGTLAMIPIMSFVISFALQFVDFIKIMVLVGGLTFVLGIVLIKTKSLILLDKIDESCDIIEG